MYTITKKAKPSFLIVIFLVLSFLGIADSVYLTYAHFTPGVADFCGLRPDFDCDVVNTSEYSTIDGLINFFFKTNYYIPIPMGLLSALNFLFLFISAFIVNKNKIITFRSINVLPGIILRICRISLFFSTLLGIFLIYVQSSILMKWCTLCIILDGIIIASLILVCIIINRYYPYPLLLGNLTASNNESSEAEVCENSSAVACKT